MDHLSVHLIARAFVILSLSVPAVLICLLLPPVHAAVAQGTPAPAPIVLTGADRRPAMSLNGGWGAIVDP